MKLFKKVAAAVLAGVMALSMVACGTTPVTPDVTPDAPASDAAVTEVLSWLNKSRVTDDYGKETKLIENDADLAKQASVILNTIASDVAIPTADRENRVGRLNGAKVVYDTIDAKLAYNLAAVGAKPLADKGAVYMLKAGAIAKVADTKAKAEFDLNNTYKLDADLKKALDTNGKAMTVEGKDTDNKIGIASKTINGQTYVVIVANDSAAAKLGA